MHERVRKFLVFLSSDDHFHIVLIMILESLIMNFYGFLHGESFLNGDRYDYKYINFCYIEVEI